MAALNPGVTLPNLAITPVLRGDLAGTNFVLQQWCIAEAPTVWAVLSPTSMPTSPSSPTATRRRSARRPQFGLPSVIERRRRPTATRAPLPWWVQPTASGDITYVEPEYAKEYNNKPVAFVENASGDFVQPTPENVAGALAYAIRGVRWHPGTELSAAPGAMSTTRRLTRTFWPVPTGLTGLAYGQTLGGFLNYVLTIGEKEAPAIDYSTIGLALEQYGISQAQNIPGYPALTATEQANFAAGDVTPSIVQADGVRSRLPARRAGHDHHDGGHDHDNGGHDHDNGGHDHDNGGHDDDDGGHDHHDGGHDDDNGGHDHDNGGHDRHDGGHDGDNGGHDGVTTAATTDPARQVPPRQVPPRRRRRRRAPRRPVPHERRAHEPQARPGPARRAPAPPRRGPGSPGFTAHRPHHAGDHHARPATPGSTTPGTTTPGSTTHRPHHAGDHHARFTAHRPHHAWDHHARSTTHRPHHARYHHARHHHARYHHAGVPTHQPHHARYHHAGVPTHRPHHARSRQAWFHHTVSTVPGSHRTSLVGRSRARCTPRRQRDDRHVDAGSPGTTGIQTGGVTGTVASGNSAREQHYGARPLHLV